MDVFRHAANAGARTRMSLIVTILSALTAAAAVTSAVLTVSWLVARRVVTPVRREADARIVDVDTAAQTVTLERTDDTILPGRYGLFTEGTQPYVKIGSVLAADERTVKRKLLTHIGADARISPLASFSGWYFAGPEELQLPFTQEVIDSPIGPCPAWCFTVDGARTWAIIVHGRGGTRGEGLRAVPVFHALGMTSLVVSYRNDGEAPNSRSGTYALGATEWRDVDAAVHYARTHGADSVILMGWSMGGAIALQTVLNSTQPDAIAGVVLESPVMDWRVVLTYQAQVMKLPRPVTDLALGALQGEWGVPVTGGAVALDRLDMVARSMELRHPMLILHSDDDGFVPSDASHELLKLRPDLVELHVFEVARHAKLWNYDQERWTQAIRAWVLNLIEAREAAGS